MRLQSLQSAISRELHQPKAGRIYYQLITRINFGANGILVDFFDVKGIADRVEEALDNPDKMQTIRQNARQTILEKYDLANLLPQHLAWIKNGCY